jgi:replicative DNA helicase
MSTTQNGHAPQRIQDAIPHDSMAEEHLLGILLSHQGMSRIAGTLEPLDFYHEAHQRIYGAMQEVYLRRGSVDFLSVSLQLAKNSEVIRGELGGGTYLITLSDRAFDRFLNASQVEAFAECIISASLKRAGMDACGLSAQDFMGGEEGEVALARAAERFNDLGKRRHKTDFVSMSSLAEESVERVSARKQAGGGIVGIPTPFHDLTRMLRGFQEEKLILIAGRPGMGKSAMLIAMAYEAAKRGRKVGILSLEMSKEDLYDRFAAIDSHLNANKIREGNLDDDEFDRFVASSAYLSELDIAIDDTFGCSLFDLKSKAKRFQETNGMGILFVDYLQLMDADTPDSDNEVQALSIISRGLKGIARDMHIPVVALAQLSREVEKRQSKIPQMSDLRGSGALEQNADVVAFLYRDEEYNRETDRPGQADIIVAKNREGEKGVVVVGFDHATMHFYDPYPQEQP